MPFSIIDPKDFLDNEVFKEDSFLERIEMMDWTKYLDKKVLIRGCTSAIIPPWAYMVITGKLTSISKSIRFGNEHDHIVVYRK